MTWMEIIKLTINHLLDNDTEAVVLPQNTNTVGFKPNSYFINKV